MRISFIKKHMLHVKYSTIPFSKKFLNIKLYTKTYIYYILIKLFHFWIKNIKQNKE